MTKAVVSECTYYDEAVVSECTYRHEAVVSEYAYKETFYEEAVVLFSCKGLYSTVEKEHG